MRVAPQLIIHLIVIAIFAPSVVSAQTAASASNWLYPHGNSEATRHQAIRSLPQDLTSLVVKWATSAIRGPIQPLIGNLVNNPPLLPTNSFAPNEIAAVVGNELVIVGADGKTISRDPMPPWVNNVSVLFDSLALLPSVFTQFPVVMGLEVTEHNEPEENLAFSYIAAYSQDSAKSIIIKRLTIQLDTFQPNLSAGVKPIFGRNNAGEMIVYSAVNMSDPQPINNPLLTPPYFRGLTQFNTSDFTFPFPRPDVLDLPDNQYTVGPDVFFAPPSITNPGGLSISVLLPCFPSLNLGSVDPIDNLIGPLTNSSEPYILDLDIGGPTIQLGPAWTDLPDIDPLGRPRVRPLYVRLTDAGAVPVVENLFILVAEEYWGSLQNSSGVPTLHIYDANSGVPLTFPDPSPLEEEQSYAGTFNHLWSIAVGDVDGILTDDGSQVNERLPHYPNNPGNEIIVTQNSPDFAVAENRLSVLRYRTGTRIPKINTNQDLLRFLDTIATQRMTGWIAAINDIDGAPNGKEEIFLADGNVLRILRLRDYVNFFGTNQPFEEVYSYDFGGNETIKEVAIADLDGDNLNDILVTTDQKIHLIGKKIIGNFVVTSPKGPDSPPEEFCEGATIPLQWSNNLGGNPTVNIYFQPYNAGTPVGARRLIQAQVPNTTDNVNFPYIVDRDDILGEGRFIVESVDNPQVSDSSSIIRMSVPSITIDSPLNFDVYMVGQTVTVAGITTCMDEVFIQRTTGASVTAEWVSIDRAIPDAAGAYSVDIALECFPFFNCFGPDSDSLIRFRAVGFRFVPGQADPISDTTDERTIVLRPETLVIDVDPEADVVCQERTIMWSGLPGIPECDSITVAVSLDSGATYSLIELLAASDGEFLWRVPPNLPDSLFIRVCCRSACARADLQIIGTELKFINVVAPNPFDPFEQNNGLSKPGVNVVYEVPEPVTVSIRVYDQSNRIIAEPLKSQQRFPNQTYCDNWDGFIERENTVAPNGMYYLVMEFSNGDRQVYNVFVAKGY